MKYLQLIQLYEKNIGLMHFLYPVGPTIRNQISYFSFFSQAYNAVTFHINDDNESVKFCFSNYTFLFFKITTVLFVKCNDIFLDERSKLCGAPTCMKGLENSLNFHEILGKGKNVELSL
jgi:hypothetical protein